ncbi:MAG: D-glycero-beta-D-manno-heptose 1-phosphate adenylyltransferase, partial [Deltaproteobacteria bacterium]|nr:D-glycero-beta-D-manno-heptose 1-phosphate adenylyltransferase [Deltaproteobacteria bacterium]
GRANKGMTLFLNENEHLHVPAIKGNVFDATGAGDTVIAVLTMALAAGGEIEDAALLSSYGAAVAISKTGTAPCSGKELRRMLSVQPTHVNKILSDREIAAAVKEHKEKGATIVFTNGCFDIIHAGHVRYLMEAKKCGDILIVGLNGDESVRSLKGQSRPFIPEAERAEILAALECVDYVTIFPETTPDALIRLIKPDFHIKGEDYKIDDLPEKGLVESIGGKVLVAASGINRSSSEIIGWIQRETRN